MFEVYGFGGSGLRGLEFRVLGYLGFRVGVQGYFMVFRV